MFTVISKNLSSQIIGGQATTLIDCTNAAYECKGGFGKVHDVKNG